MAKITYNDKSIEVNDNTPIRQACEELGIPFGCRHGVCGACRVEIIDGSENLKEMTQAEKDIGLEKKERLACQAMIKSGEIKIKEA